VAPLEAAPNCRDNHYGKEGRGTATCAVKPGGSGRHMAGESDCQANSLGACNGLDAVAPHPPNSPLGWWGGVQFRLGPSKCSSPHWWKTKKFRWRPASVGLDLVKVPRPPPPLVAAARYVQLITFLFVFGHRPHHFHWLLRLSNSGGSSVFAQEHAFFIFTFKSYLATCSTPL
jgi:hypothetical protein